MKPRSAIATTLRDAEDVLASFIDYHLAIGFDHLFLFFDATDAQIPQYVQDNPRITVFQRNITLSYAWEATTLFLTPALARSVESEVMTRQLLNAEIALRHAHQLGIDWLLHIDIDELFYTTQDVSSHFRKLETQGIDMVLYHNLEAIPELSDIDNYFKEVSLFKVNPVAAREQLDVRQFAELTNAIPQIPPQLFHFYSNGKSAVKVREETLPKGVHKFSIPPGSQAIVEQEEPVILHYPVCGAKHFERKYLSRDMSREKWFNKPGQMLSNMPAYKEGHAVVQTGSTSEIQSYFIKHYVISDREHIECLLDTGLCKRITAPATLIRQLDLEEA